MDETSAGPGAVRLVHDDDRDRYEALDGSELLAVLYYGDEPAADASESAGTAEGQSAGAAAGPGPATVRDLRSTVVAPEHNGRGVGSALVRFALDDAREHSLRVRATCWFVRGWIERHPEYADLLEEPSAGSGTEGR
ncbi:GNAT family N-acetyltransferase [Brachybacterium sp. GCM10030267]|uniref:GNAT family N-acetyltransferase n=1 Tax=unclassified Brachybacterium TaxID=2623841 RepID=UPI0036199D45